MVSFSFQKREVIFLAGLLLAALAVRLILFPLEGYQNDTNTFISWFGTAAEHGIRPFYSVVSWCDYPPFNVYIFWVFGSLTNSVAAWGIGAASIVKVAPTIFDLATSVLIYYFLRRELPFKQSLITTAFYAFNPAIIFNVAVWGQFDAIYTFFLVLSLMVALKKYPEVSALVFAVALLTKPQGIALLPLVALVILKKNGIKRLLTSTAAFVGSFFLFILPFEWTNPVTFLSDIYFGAYSGYQYTSINAFNLWGMFGLWIPDGSLNIVGWAMFGAFSAFTIYILYKRFHVSGNLLAIYGAFLLFFAFFMFPTRIHERYLFPAISILVLLLPYAKKIRLLYVGLTATLFVNQAYVLAFLNSADPFIPQGDLVVLAVSVINLVLFFYASVLLLDKFRGRSIFNNGEPKLTKEEALPKPEEGLSNEL
jgi:Gpi18-like mannosyltransferase